MRDYLYFKSFEIMSYTDEKVAELMAEVQVLQTQNRVLAKEISTINKDNH